MKNKRLLYIHLFLFIPFIASAQSKIIDSLLNVLKTEKVNSQKVKCLNELAVEYEDSFSFYKAIAVADSAIRISDIMLNENKDENAKPLILKAKAKSYQTLGGIYYDKGAYPEALMNYFSGLKIYESLKNKTGVALSYNSIGNVYDAQTNFDEALKNYQLSLAISDSAGDKLSVARCNNNIGNIYAEQGKLDDALKHYSISLKMKQELNDKSGIAFCYNNIGNIYVLKQNYDEAIKNYTACLKLREELNHKPGIAATYGNIGELYLRQKKYKEAEHYLQKGKMIAKEIGYNEELQAVYYRLTFLDSAKGDFKGALENQKLYTLYRDSLNNEESRKKTIQTQMTHDFEKKEAVANAEHKKELENQEKLSEEKSRKQKLIIAFVVLGLILVIVFAGFVLRSLRLTRKQKNIIEEQKNTVEQKKKVVESQKLLIEEKQKEIIDSITYAKRLQQAILPSDEEIKKHFPQSFILYKPKDIVAGDFYWLYYSPAEDTVFLAAADSTGHGVPGAMVSVVCSNALNRATNEFHLTSTGLILDKTRELVLETFEKSGEEIKDGMDISLIAFNKKSKTITWSGANNPLWMLNDNTLTEIKPNKQSIGKTEHPQPFTSHQIIYEKNTCIYLFTDGYADQFGGPNGKKYKHKLLQEKLIASGNLSTFKQQETLSIEFDKWKGNLEQVDDVTIIGIRL